MTQSSFNFPTVSEFDLIPAMVELLDALIKCDKVKPIGKVGANADLVWALRNRIAILRHLMGRAAMQQGQIDAQRLS